MAMTNPVEPILHPIEVKALRPTQMTVGMREVEAKRTMWRARALKDGSEFLGGHMIPTVIGPGDTHWVIDHHHLLRALHDEGVSHVLVSVVARLDGLRKSRFFSFMDARNWLHPYDAEGKRCDWKDLPRHIGKVADDPYRSLAGELRRAGGYAKSPVPYTEFLWADFLRDQIKPEKLEHDFDRALRKAMALARSPGAQHLPGFAGPDD